MPTVDPPQGRAKKHQPQDESAIAEISRLALTALLYEAAASPKPGLVSPDSPGAHADMDYYTFLDSAAALAPWFERFARIGFQNAGSDPRDVLPPLRSAGKKAEAAMFAATKGVNTHKGLIFSLGTLCAAAGMLAAEGETIDASTCAHRAARILQGTTDRDFMNLESKDPASLTAGERLYLRWGVAGIRREAEQGFSSVTDHALLRFERDLSRGVPRNEALINALLELFTLVEDTNVLNRVGLEGLQLLRERARTALDLGGASTTEGRKAVAEMDELLTARGISPGGCADLLSVTVFLSSMRDLAAIFSPE